MRIISLLYTIISWPIIALLWDPPFLVALALSAYIFHLQQKIKDAKRRDPYFSKNTLYTCTPLIGWFLGGKSWYLLSFACILGPYLSLPFVFRHILFGMLDTIPSTMDMIYYAPVSLLFTLYIYLQCHVHLVVSLVMGIVLWRFFMNPYELIILFEKKVLPRFTKLHSPNRKHHTGLENNKNSSNSNSSIKYYDVHIRPVLIVIASTLYEYLTGRIKKAPPSSSSSSSSNPNDNDNNMDDGDDDFYMYYYMKYTSPTSYYNTTMNNNDYDYDDNDDENTTSHEEKLIEELYGKSARLPPQPVPKGSPPLIRNILKADTHYKVLGLEITATDEEIRKAKRTLSLATHPDKNTSVPGCHLACQRVIEAAQTLLDPVQKKEYDEMLLFYQSKEAKEAFHKYIDEVYSESGIDITRLHETVIMACSCERGVHQLPLAREKTQSHARRCDECKTNHPVKDDEIWIESRRCLRGLRFGYEYTMYTCVKGRVYDATEIAVCEGLLRVYAEVVKGVNPHKNYFAGLRGGGKGGGSEKKKHQSGGGGGGKSGGGNSGGVKSVNRKKKGKK